MFAEINWDLLETTIQVCVPTTETLPEGIYACPRCEATGRIEIGCRDPGPNKTLRCGMCNGTRKIKKCKMCQEKPVPFNDNLGICEICSKKYMDHILELEKRPEIICNYPDSAAQCPTRTLQEHNSNGHLVCDLDSCNHAQRMYSVYPSECIVRKTNGDDYCIYECVDREFCPMNKAGED